MIHTLSGVRFAPSPTGRFHVGNLRTAWIASSLAKILKQPLIVRIEDIDSPRVIQDADKMQLSDMAAIGVSPTQIYKQSEKHQRHFDLFLQAFEHNQIYPCDCSRKEVQAELAGLASAPHAQVPIYSGRCRSRNPLDLIASTNSESLAWRFIVSDTAGQSDFVIARTPPLSPEKISKKDFVPAYHWACAIDDYDGAYSLLIRAWDLATSLPLQRAIQKWLFDLSNKTPIYPSVFHSSLIVQNDGHRLEKRTPGVTLKELLDSGVTIDTLLNRFEQSFKIDGLDLNSPPGSVLGEAEKALTLASLGIKSG